jgi:hypothetical protein
MKSLARNLGAFWAAALLLAAGCATADTPPLAENYPVAYLQIQQWVPLGTTVMDAQKIMRAHGFTCTVTRHAQWGSQSDVDYVYCDQIWSATNSGLIVRRRWQVALFLTDNKVSSMYLATGLLGA